MREVIEHMKQTEHVKLFLEQHIHESLEGEDVIPPDSFAIGTNSIAMCDGSIVEIMYSAFIVKEAD